VLDESAQLDWFTEARVMTTPAIAIRNEIRELIHEQIERFGQSAPFNTIRIGKLSLSRRKNKATWPRTRPCWSNDDCGRAVWATILTDWGAAVLSASGDFKPNFISVVLAKRTTAPQVRLLSERKQPIVDVQATSFASGPTAMLQFQLHLPTTKPSVSS
jgi:hypothetical protein